MKSCLINPLGTTPMVASEMVELFKKDYDKSLNDIILIVTNEKRIISGAYMVGSAIKNRYPQVSVHYEFLDLEDITEENNIYEFIDLIGQIIKREKEDFNVDKVYANISGGRKVESVILSNFSQMIGIDEVWIVLNKNIQNYNILFERNLDKLKYFENGENLDYYKQNQEDFDLLFFPNRSELSYFEIPSLKFSIDDIKLLKELLKGKNLEEFNVPDYKIDAFIKSNLLANNKKRSIPTPLGEVISKYI